MSYSVYPRTALRINLHDTAREDKGLPSAGVTKFEAEARRQPDGRRASHSLEQHARFVGSSGVGLGRLH